MRSSFGERNTEAKQCDHIENHENRIKTRSQGKGPNKAFEGTAPRGRLAVPSPLTFGEIGIETKHKANEPR